MRRPAGRARRRGRRSELHRADRARRSAPRSTRRMPDRFAFKHAHSEVNPEARLGRQRAACAAIRALGAEQRSHAGAKGKELTWANTLVIASSVSNGGGASLRAAEHGPEGHDRRRRGQRAQRQPGLRQGLRHPPGKRRAARRAQPPAHRLHDAGQRVPGLRQLRAELRRAAALHAPGRHQAFAAGTCASLAQLGLLKGKSTAEQAAEAQRAINGYGILPEQNELQPAYWLFESPQGISVTYANAYARASVADDLCGYSFAATAPASPYHRCRSRGRRRGAVRPRQRHPAHRRVQLVNDLASGGPTRNDVSVSPA